MSSEKSWANFETMHSNYWNNHRHCTSRSASRFCDLVFHQQFREILFVEKVPASTRSLLKNHRIVNSSTDEREISQQRKPWIHILKSNFDVSLLPKRESTSHFVVSLFITTMMISIVLYPLEYHRPYRSEKHWITDHYFQPSLLLL